MDTSTDAFFLIMEHQSLLPCHVYGRYIPQFTQCHWLQLLLKSLAYVELVFDLVIVTWKKKILKRVITLRTRYKTTFPMHEHVCAHFLNGFLFVKWIYIAKRSMFWGAWTFCFGVWKNKMSCRYGWKTSMNKLILYRLKSEMRVYNQWCGGQERGRLQEVKRSSRSAAWMGGWREYPASSPYPARLFSLDSANRPHGSLWSFWRDVQSRTLSSGVLC